MQDSSKEEELKPVLRKQRGQAKELIQTLPQGASERWVMPSREMVSNME